MPNISSYTQSSKAKLINTKLYPVSKAGFSRISLDDATCELGFKKSCSQIKGNYDSIHEQLTRQMTIRQEVLPDYSIVSKSVPIFIQYQLEDSKHFDVDVNKRFEEHSKKWKEETLYKSSLTDIYFHPSYQKIIGLGPAVLSLILNDLKKKPKLWFWALECITNENPVKKEHEGNISLMTKDWLDWGIEHNLL